MQSLGMSESTIKWSQLRTDRCLSRKERSRRNRLTDEESPSLY